MKFDFSFIFLLIVTASTLSQVAVATLSSVITHKASFCRSAWMVITIAFWMMVVRRFAVSYEIMTDVRGTPFYYWPEIVGLFLSLILFHGLWILNKCYSEEVHNLTTLSEEMPAMVQIMNAKGFSTYLNKKWYNYTGLSASQSLGFAWHQTIHSEDLATIWDYWQTCLAQACAFEGKMRIKNKEGNYRWHVVRALPMKDEAGKVYSWFATMVDVQNYILDKETLYGRK